MAQYSKLFKCIVTVLFNYINPSFFLRAVPLRPRRGVVLRESLTWTLCTTNTQKEKSPTNSSKMWWRMPDKRWFLQDFFQRLDWSQALLEFTHHLSSSSSSSSSSSLFFPVPSLKSKWCLTTAWSNTFWLRSLTNLTYNIWLLTYDLWHMTIDIWHMTDIWLLTNDIWLLTYDIWHMTIHLWPMQIEPCRWHQTWQIVSDMFNNFTTNR